MTGFIIDLWALGQLTPHHCGSAATCEMGSDTFLFLYEAEIHPGESALGDTPKDMVLLALDGDQRETSQDSCPREQPSTVLLSSGHLTDLIQAGIAGAASDLQLYWLSGNRSWAGDLHSCSLHAVPGSGKICCLCAGKTVVPDVTSAHLVCSQRIVAVNVIKQ